MAMRIYLTDPRRVKYFDNWVYAWSHYEKLVVKYVGVGCHVGFVDYCQFMAEGNKTLNWYTIPMYDFKHRIKLASTRTIVDWLQFYKADINLFPTILDSTAIRPNTTRYSRCRGYDHVNRKQCAFRDESSWKFCLIKD